MLPQHQCGHLGGEAAAPDEASVADHDQVGTDAVSDAEDGVVGSGCFDVDSSQVPGRSVGPPGASGRDAAEPGRTKPDS